MKKILVVAGPTAVGKTEYAIKLAQKFNGEIVSCDSMQLYKFMDIGSAKPTKKEQLLARHHLIDFVDPREEFSVAIYQRLAKEAIDKILCEGKLPIITGGTGLYLNSILYDMDFGTSAKNDEIRKKYEDIAIKNGNHALYEILEQKAPDVAARLHKNNVKRVIRALEAIELNGHKIDDFNIAKKNSEYMPIMLCLTRDREELYDRINRRVDILIQNGLLDEIKMLMQMGLTEDNISMKGIGYKEFIRYLNGEYDLEHAIWLVKRNTRRYAKRQLTWFRRYNDIKWFNLSNQGEEEIISWVAQRI